MHICIFRLVKMCNGHYSNTNTNVMLQVLGSTGKSASSKATGGYFGITAKADAGAGASIATTTSNFQFVADFSGKSTLDVKSAPSNFRMLSLESLQQNVALRSTAKLMFCPKSISNCTDADWVDETCTAPDCKITGATVEHSTKKFGTYVLHGSNDIQAPSDTSTPKSSAASTLSAALAIVVAALVYLCI